MEYIKLYEEYNNIIQFDIFKLQEETYNDTRQIYGSWLNKEDAIEDLKIYDTNYPDDESYIILIKYHFKIPYNMVLKELDYDEDDIEDMTVEEIIEDFKDNVDWYKLDNYYDYDHEVLFNIDAQNKSTDDMIDNVIDKLNDYFGRSYKNGFSKYTNLYRDDNDNITFDSDNGEDYNSPNYIEYEPITIRIADHTHNPKNGLNDLNVLIVNDDKTKDKYLGARTDLKYDSVDDVDSIVDDIINFWKQ